MPRDIPVGNGKLLIAFDEDYGLRDLYFPHVGKENHSGGYRFRFGLWSEGRFSWISKDSWELRLAYREESLLTEVFASNPSLEVSLRSSDLVDYWENIYLREITISNLSDREREFRFFFHHDFHIQESAEGDTAYYDPDERAVIHYKGRRYFLVSGLRRNQQGIDQFATGIKEFQALEGTWKDAEDGRLEGGAIAQGSVDSTICLSDTVPARGERTLHYWICAGKDFAEVSRLNRMVQGHSPEFLIKRTASYWRAWVNKEDYRLEALPPAVSALFKKSLLILRTNIDAGGAILAGNDSDIQHYARDTYSYMWPRDGALSAYALDLAGYHDLTRQFFDFCFDIIRQGKEAVGYFLHKYNPDKSLGSSWHPWVSDGEKRLPIQEDGTGLILWALWLHFAEVKDIEFMIRIYKELIIRCGDFLASYRNASTGLPLPCYDLWEEKWGVHTFTVSAVYAGLRAAESFAGFFGDAKRVRIYGKAAAEVKEAMAVHLYDPRAGRFLKTVRPAAGAGGAEADPTVDASLYGTFYFGAFAPDDERVRKTMAAVRESLWVKTSVGGLARYEKDAYHRVTDKFAEVPGNPWFICTLWLAQWHIATAKNREELRLALPLLDWVAARALPSGVLAEQVHPHSDEPLSVSPLTWSHATFVAAVLEYRKKHEALGTAPAAGRRTKESGP